MGQTITLQAARRIYFELQDQIRPMLRQWLCGLKSAVFVWIKVQTSMDCPCFTPKPTDSFIMCTVADKESKL